MLKDGDDYAFEGLDTDFLFVLAGIFTVTSDRGALREACEYLCLKT